MYVIKKSLSSVVVLTAFLLTTSAFAMEKEFKDVHDELRARIVREAAYEQCLDDDTSPTLNKTLGNLALVCKEWHALILDERKVGTESWKAWYGVVGHEDIYQQFLNGSLLYRPDPQSDKGMIQLKISDLTNPLEGTFDLSQCGDTGNFLSISTGYRKGMKAENSNKLEIWLAPRFMIEKKLKSSASHLQPIMGTWKEETAPIGILWSWGGWKDLSWYDYLTTHGAVNISSKNLYENGRSSVSRLPPHLAHGAIRERDFMFICEPK